MIKFNSDTRFKKDFIGLSKKIKETGIVDLKNVDFDYLPTLRCNLNCKHCRQAEVRPDKNWREIKNEMNMNQIRKAWDKINIKDIIVKINGGEPFVKKEMFDIFDYFKSRGAYNIVATNASIFSNPENVEKLKKVGLVEITTSIDGIGATHDEVRGHPKLFDIMTRFAKEMAKDHKVLFECCIQALNVHQLPEMLLLSKELGIYKIRFQLPVFTTKEEIEEASGVMGEKLKYEAQVMDEPSYDFSFMDLMHSYESMLKMQLPFDMHPHFFKNGISDAFLCYGRKFRSKYKLLCSYMFRAKIDPNGDLRFCPYIIKSFGNIQKDNLEDIWNSNEFKEFRIKILNNNMLPSCENCPHLRIFE